MSVKAFRAGVFCALLLPLTAPLAQGAGASNLCPTVMQVPDFDPRANQSAYENLVRQMLDAGFTDSTGFRKFYSGLDDPRLQELLNKATLGIFGHIEKPQVQPNQKIRWIRDEVEIAERRMRILKNSDYTGLDSVRPADTSATPGLAGGPTGITVRPLNNDYVVVSLQNLFSESVSVTPWGNALRGRLMISYLRLNAKAYRKDSLVPDEPLSGFKMLDEFTENAFGLNIGESFLVFQRHVWAAEVTALNRAWDRYAKLDPKSKEAQDLLIEIQQGGPFFASMGMTVGRHMFSEDPDVEFRGLFSNESPDPLGLLPHYGAPPSNLSTTFYLQVIEGLLPFSKIDVHAHTSKHLRFYSRMGFRETRRLYSARWSRPVIELTSTREDLLRFFRGHP